jgi:hypothetical protein
VLFCCQHENVGKRAPTFEVLWLISDEKEMARQGTMCSGSGSLVILAFKR